MLNGLLLLRLLSDCNGARGNPNNIPRNPNNAPSGNKHHKKIGKLCTDLKKIVGMKNGAFITRDPAVWMHRLDGSKEYSLQTCKLKRFTATEARTCLAGKHMLFIGDSVTRYQYLSLANFIEHGKWPARFGMSNNCQHVDASGPTCEAPNTPSLVMESDWGTKYGHAPDKSWKQIHMAIGGDAFNGRMDCQCARVLSNNSMGNMRYQSRPVTNSSSHTLRGGEGEGKAVELTFMDYKGSMPLRGLTPTNCQKSSTCSLSSEQWYELRDLSAQNKIDYTLDIHLKQKADFHEKLETLLPGVNIALFNRGLWGHLPMDTEEARGIFKNLYTLTKNNGGHCYWKGTTAGNNGALGEKQHHPEGAIKYIA